MTLFIDASALVAIIACEEDRHALVARVMVDVDPIWSAMSCWETISALRSSYRYSLEDARGEVEAFAAARPFRLVSVGDVERQIALDAYATYGRGRHPARLNMGDCFAYACAKANQAGLLYKGNDFSQTDLA